ncbi:TIGR03619 family F420-dependent LLM class oxidoreductase [Streptomyces sp. NPDC018031]|uniref:TIGR03619 family F420-dependent LLM class oxidoreductase n=1 Tax=Streptomyces sp. NPDC018031 TaxID=3365033 RepID=UPI0037B79EF0
MELHIVLPDESPTMSAAQLAGLAREAEDLGFDGVWLPDHLLPPGPYGPEQYGGVLEPLITLAHLAAVTERVRLGTSVLVLPLRDPLLLAKQSATLARLSGDRFVLGVGTGWESYEFDAANADFAGRGRRATEALRLIRRMHTTGGGPYTGEFHSFDERAVFQPVPDRPVPFLIGGNSGPALRRAAQLGDWWQGVALSPESFTEHRDRLRALTDRPVAAGTRIQWGDDRPATEVAEEIAAFAAAGADHLAVWCGEVDGFAERMRQLVRAGAVRRAHAAGS